jgi:uncharacterized surface protein with fasciclin (FAS1) repeats
VSDQEVVKDTRMKSIVETAAEDGRFSTLVRALEATGLTEKLGTEPFTLFAPTDSAFAQRAGMLAALWTDIRELRETMLYHLVAGRLMSGDMIGFSSVQSAQGSVLKIRGNAQVITVNGVQVIVADIEAVNGIIHVIGAVLLPS